MKKFDLPSAIVNTVLSVCMAMAVVGCLTTAFHLEFSVFEVLLSCLFWAGMTCVALQLHRGWIATVASLALWGIWLWFGCDKSQFLSLLRTLFDICGQAYGIRIPSALRPFTDPRVTQAMAVIGGSIALLAGVSLTTLRSGTLALLTAALAIMPCFLVTDTVPHEIFLFLLLSCGGLIILTQSLRQRSPRRASRLTAMLLVPVVLSNMLLLQGNPQQEYTKQPENLFEQLYLEWIAPLIPSIDPSINFNPSFTVDPSFTIDPNLSLSNVNLQFVGPKKNGTTLVMKVQTDLDGVLYLRGKSYRDYNGKAWSAPTISDDTLEIDTAFRLSSANSTYTRTISIRTVSPHSIYYSAYYDPSRVTLQNGALSNPGKETAYSSPVDPLRMDWETRYQRYYPNISLAELKWMGNTPAGFTELPEETRIRAEKILAENDIDPDNYVLSAAKAIESLVRRSARYSLDTPFMPSGEPDFALWFLENSDIGYCIHFASAAVVLLRAAGIPARYVEGYMSGIDSSGTARVTEDQAHAWVEYWLPGLGWVSMDPTPSSNQTPPDPTTRPTEPTTRPTEPTTRPTAPTTKPTEPATIPTEPTTEPTEPATKPTAPTTGPTEPATKPTVPTTGSTGPATKPSSSTPSTTTPGHTDPQKPKRT